jgi:diguanylate cyclase (GGDEF)-like protein/PAS domain S-box-containing protein
VEASVRNWIDFIPVIHDDSLLYQASYNPILILASVSIAVFSSYVALLIARPTQGAVQQRQWLWTATSALTLGVGIWAMHFIGMLALSLPCGVNYSPSLTFLSMLPGIVCSGVALHIVRINQSSMACLVVASMVLGLGIGTLHYIGMAAMRFDGLVLYEAKLFALSVVAAVVLSFVALLARARIKGNSKKEYFLGAAIMGGAVAGVHYTAMASAHFVSGDAATAQQELISTNLLAIAIVTTTVLLTLMLLALSSALRSRSIAQQLKETNQRWDFALGGAGYGVWDWEVQSGEAFYCKRWKAMLGYQEHEFANTEAAWRDHMHPQDIDRVNRTLKAYFDGASENYSAEYRLRCKDGSYKWILSRGMVVSREPDGTPIRMSGTHGDMTERKKMLDSLRKLTVAVEQSPSSIMITDLDANIVYANTAFTRTTGYQTGEVIGRNPRLLQSGKTSRQTHEDLWAHLSKGEVWKGELLNLRKDGTEFIESALISPVRDDDGHVTSYLAIKEDITEQRKTEARIQNLAHFDQLTGLPNRILLDDHFQYALSLCERNGDPLAVMFLDLDHFKNINDSLGHRVGDLLLMEMSRRIKSGVRDIDTVARLGGDEFVFVLPGTDAVGAATLAQKVLDIVSVPLVIEENELACTASIGIALYPADGRDMETLSKCADAAMYRVKHDSHNDFCFFASTMQANLSRNLQLASALRHAIVRQQLTLHYQPQISMQDGSVIGAEALLRWRHPELGIVSPGEFIPVAEETGLIIPIGEWVLRTAVAQMKAWVDQGLAPILIAVNLSAIQFRQSNLLEMVAGILNEFELPAGQLELELTEAVAMKNPAGAVALMDQLHERGIRMSIDDFGTGYSSLSYLKRFQVYKLKIDQSFVRDITDDSESRAIVTAVINMASSLGMKTIAEGVETSAQLAFLRLQGCDEVQGYFFSKPLPAEQFLQFVQSKGLQPGHS